MNNIEIVGIVGTLFILIAFLQNGELSIRVFDGIGAVLFVIYGLCIRSFSTVLLNGILVIIQLVKIYKILERLEKDSYYER